MPFLGQDLSGFDHGAAAAAAAATAATATTAATVRGRQRQSLASPFQSKSTPTVSQEGGPLRRGASSLPPASPKTSGFGRRKANYQDVDLHDDEASSRLLISRFENVKLMQAGKHIAAISVVHIQALPPRCSKAACVAANEPSNEMSYQLHSLLG